MTPPLSISARPRFTLFVPVPGLVPVAGLVFVAAVLTMRPPHVASLATSFGQAYY
jgi:hypothetical protein